MTGEHLPTTKYDRNANRVARLNANGQPLRDPAKDSHPDGVPVSPTNGSAANWPPPACNPDTGLFYVAASEDCAMHYATEADLRGSIGLDGRQHVLFGSGPNLYAYTLPAR